MVIKRQEKNELPDVETVRWRLYTEIGVVRNVCRRLVRAVKTLPVPENQDAMFDDRIPMDVPTFMASAIECTVHDSLEAAMAQLGRAARMTAEELRRDFATRHAGYRRSQNQSGERPSMPEGPPRAGHSRKET